MVQMVTAAVKAAFEAQTIERTYKCLINWISGVDKAGTITADEWDATYGLKVEASNGIVVETPKRPFILSDSLKLSESPWLLRTAAEIGWLGDTRSDGSGDFVASQDWEIIYDNPLNVLTITVIGATYSFPVDFDLYYRDSVGVWQFINSYSGVTSTTTIFEFPVLTEITGTRIEIDKISEIDMFPCIIEIDLGFEDDVSDDIVSMQIKKEAEYETATIDIGNISANELTLILDNTAQRYNEGNGSSPVQNFLKANKRVQVFIGVEEGGVITYIPQGVYFIRDIIPKSKMITEFRCLDRMGLMNEQDYETSAVDTNKRIDELVVEVLQAFGLAASEYSVETTTGTVPFSYFEKRRYAFHLKKLAEGEGGVCYFDENGIFQFKNRDSAPSVTVEKAYDNGNILFMTPSRPYIARKMKNRVSIKSKTLEEMNQKIIFQLVDSVTIEAGETKTIPCWFFFSPCRGIQNAVITKHADIALDSEDKYNYATFLTFTNANAADQQVTAIDIEGKPLTESGVTLADEEDSTLVGEFGEKRLSIENQFLQGYDFARSLAEDLLDINKNPQAEAIFNAKSMPYLQIGDRIAVTYTKYNMTFIQYKIVGVTINCKEGVIDTMRGRATEQILFLKSITYASGLGTIKYKEIIFTDSDDLTFEQTVFTDS